MPYEFIRIKMLIQVLLLGVSIAQIVNTTCEQVDGLRGARVVVLYDSTNVTDEVSLVLEFLERIDTPLRKLSHAQTYLLDYSVCPQGKDAQPRTPSVSVYRKDTAVPMSTNQSLDIIDIGLRLFDAFHKPAGLPPYTFHSEEDLLAYYLESGHAPIVVLYTSNRVSFCNKVAEAISTAIQEVGGEALNVTFVIADCNGKRDMVNFCARSSIRGLPGVHLILDNAITQFPHKHVTFHDLYSWLDGQFNAPNREKERTAESAKLGFDEFNEYTFAELAKDAYDETGAPKEWPLKPDVLSLLQKLGHLKTTISGLKEALNAYDKQAQGATE